MRRQRPAAAEETQRTDDGHLAATAPKQFVARGTATAAPARASCVFPRRVIGRPGARVHGHVSSPPDVSPFYPADRDAAQGTGARSERDHAPEEVIQRYVNLATANLWVLRVHKRPRLRTHAHGSGATSPGTVSPSFAPSSRPTCSLRARHGRARAAYQDHDVGALAVHLGHKVLERLKLQAVLEGVRPRGCEHDGTTRMRPWYCVHERRGHAGARTELEQRKASRVRTKHDVQRATTQVLAAIVEVADLGRWRARHRRRRALRPPPPQATDDRASGRRRRSPRSFVKTERRTPGRRKPPGARACSPGGAWTH